MTDDKAPLPMGGDLITRQCYVQRFTFVYCCVFLLFSMYFSARDPGFLIGLLVNIPLFLIGAPFWFRHTKIPILYMNLVSQFSSTLAFVWICACLGPGSHVGLNAIPQFILAMMMFAGLHPRITYALGALCLIQLLLPMFPFVGTFFDFRWLPENELFVLRRVFDLTVLIISGYQFYVIVDAWRAAIRIVEKEKKRLHAESDWRFRLLKILGHDIKDPATLALQLVRRIRKESKSSIDEELLDQVEKSQLLVRDIVTNVEAYAYSHSHLELPSRWCSACEVVEKINPWLKTRLEEKALSFDSSKIDPAHKLRNRRKLWI